MISVDDAIETLPAGRYAVGASGGADSTALVMFLALRRDCEITLVHLDHQLREAASDGDAEFVRQLGARISIGCVSAKRSEIEPTLGALPANASARYRAARFGLFRKVVTERNLDGVVLAHHADDQAEGVLLRLLRGGGLPSLAGMSPERSMDGLRVFRPLLDVGSQALREYLRSIDQPWREDASNTSPNYRRNVVRQYLTANSSLVPLLVGLADALRRLRSTLHTNVSPLSDSFACNELRVPKIVAEHAVRRWLIDRGAPADDVSPATCQRLIAQALDVVQSPRQHYPGGILVRRRQKRIDVMPSVPLQSSRSHGKDETTPASEL